MHGQQVIIDRPSHAKYTWKPDLLAAPDMCKKHKLIAHFLCSSKSMSKTQKNTAETVDKQYETHDCKQYKV